MPDRRGFSLIELLAALAVIGLLAALVAGSLARARDAARQTREVAAARSVMLGYLVVPEERDGRLLPGRIPEAAVDETGLDLGAFGYRYTYRLAPYLGNRLLGTLFVNDQARFYDQITHRESPAMASYILSLSPSFGLNAAFVGGIWTGPTAWREEFQPLIRLENCRSPSRQLVFASARNSALGADSGYFEIRAPTLAPRWAAALDSSASETTRGWVDFRHRERAVGAFLDGHVRLLAYPDLRDMRLWAEAARHADDPAWTP